jgi:hypothetical protein
MVWKRLIFTASKNIKWEARGTAFKWESTAGQQMTLYLSQSSQKHGFFESSSGSDSAQTAMTMFAKSEVFLFLLRKSAYLS